MSDINLDDVFAVLPTPTTKVESQSLKTHEQTQSITTSSSKVETSYSSSHVYQNSAADPNIPYSAISENSEYVSYAPVQHRASVVKHAPLENRESVISVTPYIPGAGAVPVANGGSDSLLNDIFGAVALAPVEFTNRSTEETEALRHLDEACYGEEPLSPISPRAQTPSVVSQTNSQAGRGYYAYNNAPEQVADQLVEQTFGQLQNGNYSASTVSHHSSHHTENRHHDEIYASEPDCYPTSEEPDFYANSVHEVQQAEMNFGYEPEEPQEPVEPEEYDKFEPAHLPYVNKTEEEYRKRSYTMDSLASAGESRYGGFDVHDDHDIMQGQELNLNHNEVAYNRVKQKKVQGSPMPVRPFVTAQTGGTLRLQRLNQEINEARTKQQLLEEMIVKEKKAVDDLKQKQTTQQRVASAASSRGNDSRPTSRTTTQTPASYYSERSFQSPIVPLATQTNIVQKSNVLARSRSQESESHSVVSHKSTTSDGSSVNGSEFTHECEHPPASRVESRASSVSTLVSERTAAIKNTLSGDSIIEEQVGITEIAERTLQNGTQVAEENGIALIVPEHEDINNVSKDPKVHKVIFGGFQEPSIDDKTVLFFGPIGSGKTSALNSILNYLYDVKKENNFRFVTSAHTSSTRGLTAYVINNSILPFSVTIVDTPGVPDQQGNKTVSTLIKHWFESELLSAGAFRLDAISIVLAHDEDSLGWPFIHELATVKRMFGDDLKTNVLPIITNSEVLPQPIAVRSLAQANIAFVEYYKVNNSGFFANRGYLSKLQHNLYFRHGIASLELFFRDLQELIHPLLAVLRNRPSASPATPVAAFDPATLY